MSRRMSQAQKIRKRLGGSVNLDEPFPEKPKGMHWRTYRKLGARAGHAEEISNTLMMAYLNRRYPSQYRRR
jgi:hypothetical protein